MTAAVTWAQVHAGDTVRGVDGRDYTVTAVEALGRWVGSGQIEYRLELDLGDGRLRVLRRPASEPAPLIARANHSDTAAAWTALAGAGLAPDLIGETMSSLTTDLRPQQQQPQQLSDPAPSTARKEAPLGKWGWYKLPNPTWGEPGDPTEVLLPRVSTIKKTLSDEYGLTAWKLRMAVKGLALRPDLIAKAAAADIEGDSRTLDQIVESAHERAEAGAAANYGTAVHKFCERLSAGESIASMGVPGQLVPIVEGYAAVLKTHGLTVLPDLAERTIVNDVDGYAGTWDSIVRDRAGTLYVLDVKTGKDLSYTWLENAVQLAMYSRARWICSRDFTSYTPAGGIDQMKGLILHLPLNGDKPQIYGVPLDKGWRSAQLAMHVRALRGEAKKWSWLVQPDEPADVVRLHVDRAETLEALLAIRENADKRGLWSDELMVYMLARYDRIRVDGAAAQRELADLYAELHPVGRWTAELQQAGLERMAQLTAALTSDPATATA